VRPYQILGCASLVEARCFSLIDSPAFPLSRSRNRWAFYDLIGQRTHAPDHVRRQGLNLGLLFDDATVVSVELGVTIRANMVIPVTMAGPSFRLVRCISYG
jgi:hypothetical protein